MTPPVLEIRRAWGSMTLDVQHLALTPRAVTASSRTGHLWTWLGVPLGFVPPAFSLPLRLSPPMLSEVRPAPRADVLIHGLDDIVEIWQLTASSAHVQVEDGWSPRATERGVVRPWPELVAEGRAQRCAAGWRIALDAHLTLTFQVDDQTLTSRLVPAPEPLPAALPDRDDLAVAGLASFLGALAALLVLFVVPQHVRSTVHLGAEDDRAPITLHVPPEPKQAPDPEPVATKSGGGRGGEGGGGSPDGRTSTAGRDRGAADAIANLFGSLEGGLANDGIVQAGMLDGLRNLSQGWHNGPGLGLGDRRGFGGNGGDADGIGGPRTHGDDRPGSGGDGGPLSGRTTTEWEPARTGEPILMGALSRAQVDAVVKRHLRAIRYCYQRQLQRDATLGGKVVVRFTIAGDGTVSAAALADDTIHHASTTDCIVQRFWRMNFPEPQGGGRVVVKYPIHLSPAG